MQALAQGHPAGVAELGLACTPPTVGQSQLEAPGLALKPHEALSSLHSGKGALGELPQAASTDTQGSHSPLAAPGS